MPPSLLPAGIPRVDFRHQIHVIAQAFNCFTDNLFSSAFSIHLCGINQPEAQVDARTQASASVLRRLAFSPIYQVPCPIAGRVRAPENVTVFALISLSCYLHHRKANGAQAPRFDA
jgi:hypothetical protein